MSPFENLANQENSKNKARRLTKNAATSQRKFLILRQNQVLATNSCAGWTSGLVDGQKQTAAQPACVCIVHDISQGKDIIPSYAGAAPGMVNGIMQINFQITGQGRYYSLTSVSDLFSIFVAP